MTLELNEAQFERLRQELANLGFTFEERQNQVFLARRNGVVVNLYTSGKVVIGGPVEKQQSVIDILSSLGAQKSVRIAKVLPPLDYKETHIGTDEVGKGDYFGPLVVCAAMATEHQQDRLMSLRVRDSKSLGDTTIANLAVKIRKILVPEQYSIIPISPVRYNLLYKKMTNINRILGWAHATALEEVLRSDESCKLAISDQFGDESYIEDALKKRGRTIELIQTPKAERDIVVATASVLARDALLRYRLQMRNEYGEDFPLGAAKVEDFAKRLVARLGTGSLIPPTIDYSLKGRVC